MDRADVEKVKLIFKHIDKSNDGVISIKEIKNIDTLYKCTDNVSGWTKNLGFLDLQGKGIVEFHDFFTAAVDHKKYLTQ